MTADNEPGSTAAPAQPRKAAVAAAVGSALEYYDFFIYGSAAALIFPAIFFDDSAPADATLLSLATFGVAYAVRPLGALLLGHIGDRFGRKRIMLLTLLLMGAATFLIGCLPTRGQIGAAAPALLVLLRVLQGLSAAGEQAGANSMTLEHAPPHRRGWFTSFTLGGTQAGQLLATLAFIPVAALPEHHMLSWGWRIPFLLSAAVAVVGWFIRRSLHETPVFTQQAAAGEVVRMPLVVLVRGHWRSVLRVVCGALVASVSTIFTVWALSYATSEPVGMDKSGMLWVGALANVVALAAIPLWAGLSDRIGRRPVFLTGAAGSAVAMFVYLWAISTGSYPLTLLAGILAFGVVYSAANGVWPAFYGEMFPASVRLSGMAVGTQTGFAVSGFAVTFAAGIAGPEGDGWARVGLFTAALCVPPALAAILARETAHTATEDLGTDGAKGGARPADAVPAAPERA